MLAAPRCCRSQAGFTHILLLIPVFAAVIGSLFFTKTITQPESPKPILQNAYITPTTKPRPTNIATIRTPFPIPTNRATHRPKPNSTKTPSPSPSKTASPTSLPTLKPSSTPKPTPSPSLTPTPIPIFSNTPLPSLKPTASPSIAPNTRWAIQSVSSMKETKDRICNQRPADFISKWVDKAKELGANYIAVETPYDNPACGSSVSYTKAWVSTIRAKGLHVWHRHMPMAFEGIYDAAKKTGVDYLPMVAQYIKDNPSIFVAGDIFSPIPEPQNGGIQGITYCASSLCQFSNKEAFNKWLRDAIDVSNTAFQAIGLGGQMKVGYFGFDGFVSWGDNNPDWTGIIEDATIAKMGNITIDHYPEAVGDSMENDLNELTIKYPNVPIIIGEWGTTQGGDTVTAVKNSMGAAARRANVVGFNYWHLGSGGNEALINEDFSNRTQFTAVQSFFKK